MEDINIEDSMSRDYIDYSMSVIVGRALPDVRDGLKPVHRRCLYAMYKLNNTWNSKHLKSARGLQLLTLLVHKWKEKRLGVWFDENGLVTNQCETVRTEYDAL